jgi:hypothetical protein
MDWERSELAGSRQSAVAEPPLLRAIGVDLPIPKKTPPGHGAKVAGLAGGISAKRNTREGVVTISP